MSYLSSSRGPLAFTFVALVACSGTVLTSATSTSTSGGGSTSTSSAGGTTAIVTSATSTAASSSAGGGSTSGGDCTSDADCPGGTCVALTPGGWKVCAVPQPEVTACNGGPADQCCSSSQCMGNNAGCYSSYVECGGAPPIPGNVCTSDQCEADTDCSSFGPAICTPANVFGVPNRMCLPAYCHTNADCVLKAGGVCRPVDRMCCSIPEGLACVYPGDCTTFNDCTNPEDACGIDPGTGESVCVHDEGCPP
jgi:hypothetical protein